jgi:DNA-binding MarR family transcriptional regulator
MHRPAPSHRPLADPEKEDHWGFALYVATRAVTGRFRPLLAQLGLTYPQYLLMMCLWKSGELTVGQLGAQLGMESGTLSPILARLEETGLIGPHPGRTDRRTVLIALTPTGRALQERALDVSARMIEALGLDATEFEQLRTQLLQLAELDPRDRSP